MTTTLANTAEGGTDGVTPTTANSGGASGNAIDTVTVGTGNSFAFAAAAAYKGTLGYALTFGTTAGGTLLWNIASSVRVTARFYVNIPDVPTSQEYLCSFRNATGNMMTVVIDSTGLMAAQNAAGAGNAAWKGATIIPAATWIRVEVAVTKGTTTSNGRMEFAWYLGDSLTAQDSVDTGATVNTGTTAVASARLGRNSTCTQARTNWYDDFSVTDTLSSGFQGPSATNYTANPAGNIGVTDAVSVAAVYAPAPADSVGVTDAATSTISPPQPGQDQGTAFTYGATGATNATVRATLSPNGSTTSNADVTAINAAIASASSAGGGIVQLNAGTYYINSGRILMQSNVMLQGHRTPGSAPTVILKAGSNFVSVPQWSGYSVITVNAASLSNMTVKDVLCDQQSTSTTMTQGGTGRLSAYLCEFRNATNVIFDGVYTQNPFTYSIAMVSCSTFGIRNCNTQVNTSGVFDQLDGIHILESDHGDVVDNYVDQWFAGTDGDDGLVAHTIGAVAHDLNYANNNVRGGSNGSDMQLAGGSFNIYNITIQKNRFWGNPIGLHFGYYGSQTSSISNITVGGGVGLGNTFLNDTTYAVDFTAGPCTTSTVTYNTSDSGGFNVPAGNTVNNNTVLNASPNYVTSYNNTASATTPKTVSVTVSAGDTLVVYGMTANSNETLGTPTGGGLTYTLRQSSTGLTNQSDLYVWTATSASAQTFTLSVAAGGTTTTAWSLSVQQWSNVSVGASAIAHNTTGLPSVSLTTTSADSVITVGDVDWNAVTTASAFTTLSTGTVARTFTDQSTHVGSYVAHYTDSGTVGSKTVGMSAPSGQVWAIAAVELIPFTSYTPTPADTVGVTDAVAATQADVRAPADPVGVTDSLAVEQDATRSPADPVGATDAGSAVQLGERDPADPVGITDSVAAQQSTQRTAAENVGLTDAVAVEQDAVRAPSDAVNATDALTDVQGLERDPADAVGVTDSATGTITGGGTATGADTVGLVDTVSIEQDSQRSPADTVGLVDTAGITQAAERDPADNAGITDTASTVQADVRNPADAVGVTDTVQPVQAAERDPADPVNLTDTATVQQDGQRTVSDAVGVTDTATGTITGAGTSTSADPVGVTDAATVEQDTQRTAADSAGVTDAVLTAQGYAQAPSDTVGVTDAPSTVQSGERDPSEAVGLTDTATVQLSGGGTVNAADTVGVTDTVTTETDAQRTTADNAGVTDTVSTGIGYNQSPADNVGATDALTLERDLAPVDTTGATDTAAWTGALERDPNENVGVTDTVGTSQVFNWHANPADTAHATDTVSTRLFSTLDDLQLTARYAGEAWAATAYGTQWAARYAGEAWTSTTT